MSINKYKDDFRTLIMDFIKLSTEFYSLQEITKEIGVYTLDVETGTMTEHGKISVPDIFGVAETLFSLFKYKFRDDVLLNDLMEFGIFTDLVIKEGKKGKWKRPDKYHQIKNKLEISAETIDTFIIRYFDYLNLFFVEKEERNNIITTKNWFEFKEKVFQNVFTELESLLSTNRVTWLLYAPIHNLKLEDNSKIVILEKNITIRQINKVELFLFQNRGFKYRKLPAASHFDPIYHIVEIRIELQRDETRVSWEGSIEDGKHLLKHLQSYFHIYKGGNISINESIFKQENWGKILQYYHYEHRFFHDEVLFVHPFQPYELKNEEISVFCGYWSKFVKILDRLDKSIALRRFEMSLEKVDYEDRIIDLAIALESIGLKTGITQELQFRLATFVANFFGSSQDHAKYIFDVLRVFYTVRSQIVHGQGISYGKMIEKVKKVNFDDIDIFLIYIENIVRDFLKHYFIENQASQKNWEKIIEKTLIQGRCN